MSDHESGSRTARGISVVALSAGVVAGAVAAADTGAVHHEASASRSVPDRLSEIRSQFEAAFTPGAVESAGQTDSHAGMIEGSAPGAIHEDSGPNSITEAGPAMKIGP
jgi:hypothetical protein